MTRWLQWPDASQPKEHYRLNMLRIVVIAIWVICATITLFGLMHPPDDWPIFFGIIWSFAALQGLVWYYIQQRKTRLASALIIIPMWGFLAYGSLYSGGIYASVLMMFTIPLIMAGILIGINAMIAMTGVTLWYFGVLLLVETLGYLPASPERDIPFRILIVGVTFCVLTALFVFHLVETRAAEARTLRLQLEAERMAVYRQLTQDIAHDLRTPLAILNSKAFLIRGHYDKGKDIYKHLDSLEGYAAKLRDMVEDLFQLTLLDTKPGYSPKLQWEQLNLAQLLHDVLNLYESYANERNIRTALTFDDTQGVALHGDLGQLERVFGNLVENAIHYGRAGGFVEVDLIKTDEHVRVTVRDDGVGIAPEQQEKIFERFYRVDQARTSDVMTGSGIGLAVTRRIVRLHGGSISVESTLGQGSTFIVQLPLVHQLSAQQQATVATESTHSPANQ